MRPRSSRRIRLTTMFGALLLLSHSAWATDIMDVYQAAVSYDPVLGAARADLAAREEIVPQTRSLLLPTIGAQAGTSWNERSFPGANTPDQDFNDHYYSARLSQPVVNVSRWFTYNSAKATVDAANLSYSQTEQNLVVRAIDLYLAVLRGQAAVDATKAEEAAVQRQLEQVQQRFDVGLVAITDVLEAQAAYDAAVVRRIQAVGDLDIFFVRLNTLAGQPYTAIDSISEELPIINPDPANEDEWVKMAMEKNYSILAAEAQLDAARLNIKARRSDHLPTVDGTISFSRNVTGGPSFLGDEIETTVYGLTLQVPIYQGGYVNSRTREAVALSDFSAENLANNRRTVGRDTRNLFQRVSTDVIRVKARLRAITSAESALEATETGYEVGTRNIVDVLQVQNRLYLSQFDYADSRYNYLLGLFLLKQQAGVLDPKDLEDLNAYSDSTKPVTRITSLAERSAGN